MDEIALDTRISACQKKLLLFVCFLGIGGLGITYVVSVSPFVSYLSRNHSWRPVFWSFRCRTIVMPEPRHDQCLLAVSSCSKVHLVCAVLAGTTTTSWDLASNPIFRLPLSWTQASSLSVLRQQQQQISRRTHSFFPLTLMWTVAFFLATGYRLHAGVIFFHFPTGFFPECLGHLLPLCKACTAAYKKETRPMGKKIWWLRFPNAFRETNN